MPNPNIAEAGKATRFKPGNDARRANGRPKKPTLTEALREQVEADLAIWLEPYRAALESGDPKLALDAAERVFDRLDGKPTQRTETSGGLTLTQLIGDAGLGEVAE